MKPLNGYTSGTPVSPYYEQGRLSTSSSLYHEGVKPLSNSYPILLSVLRTTVLLAE